MRLIPKVELIGIDKEAMKKDDSFPSAYKLPFKLSEVPTNEWTRIFEHVYMGELYSMKRRAYIEGANIILIVADSDDFLTHADFIKRVVEQTNKEADRINDSIRAQMEREKEQRQEEQETITKLKKEVDKIKF